MFWCPSSSRCAIEDEEEAAVKNKIDRNSLNQLRGHIISFTVEIQSNVSRLHFCRISKPQFPALDPPLQFTISAMFKNPSASSLLHSIVVGIVPELNSDDGVFHHAIAVVGWADCKTITRPVPSTQRIFVRRRLHWESVDMVVARARRTNRIFVQHSVTRASTTTPPSPIHGHVHDGLLVDATGWELV